MNLKLAKRIRAIMRSNGVNPTEATRSYERTDNAPVVMTPHPITGDVRPVPRSFRRYGGNVSGPVAGYMPGTVTNTPESARGRYLEAKRAAKAARS